MDKTYNPKCIESQSQALWHKQQSGRVASGDSFCIMLPPPNVTGSLHMGHAFQQTIMDFMVRYQSMNGKDAHLQVGLDHSGIATQMVVERLLEKEGVDRHQLGRTAFIDRVWEWKSQSGGRILEQMQQLGVTADWERQRFTMDEKYCEAVTVAFVKMYRDGLIHKRKKLVNWDTKFGTAISDLEVVNVDKKGSIWHLRYPLRQPINGVTHIEIATTRPETLLGDTAIAVNPKDERYKDLVGSEVLLPLCHRSIPIVADNHVDSDFGTGLVKVTPAHDFNDYEIGQRHQLPMINILTTSGDILARAEIFDSRGQLQEGGIELPDKLQGLSVKSARATIITMLQQQGFLVKEQPHNLKIPMGDRSQTPIEPFLTDQWFVVTQDLAQNAIEAVENGSIEFIPPNYTNMYASWMHNIQDWCISRQLWWGHQIPAWYDNTGNMYVGHSEQQVRQQNNICATIKLKRDESVLDTWFSSGLWSFVTLGWPNNSEELQRRHPTDVLVTGFDIIFFWVARMIMLSLYFTKQVPFRKVYVTGLIRDERGQKMSKSKGNVLDPIDMVEGIDLESLIAKTTTGMMQPQLEQKTAKLLRQSFPQGIAEHGTDALRITLLALATHGRDINWDMQRLNGYRNFCNKLWNAARYVLGSIEKAPNFDIHRVSHSLNLWILHKLDRAIEQYELAIQQYRFDEVIRILHEFIWHQYCDWYLEMSKFVLKDVRYSCETQATLLYVLRVVLQLLHPAAPFITEAIAQECRRLDGGDSQRLLIQRAGAVQLKLATSELVKREVKLLQSIITAVRNVKAENNIAPGKALDLFIQTTDAKIYSAVQNNVALLVSLLKLQHLDCTVDSGKTQSRSKLDAVQKLPNMTIVVPLVGVIDLNTEIARLQREMKKLEKNIASLEKKLQNKQYCSNAPVQVVAKDQSTLDQNKEKFEYLTEKLQQYDTN